MRPKKILYIDPVSENTAGQKAIHHYLNRFIDPDQIEITVTYLHNAPSNLSYYAYLGQVVPEITKAVLAAEKVGYAATIIGCFCDPGLDAVKEVCSEMVVVGVMEASVHLASFLAPKFSIIASETKSIPDFEWNLGKYGLSNRLASFKSLDISIDDLRCDAHVATKRMRELVRSAIADDHAEAIILGCTMQMGLFEKLQMEFKVPVIDAQLAGLLIAETLISAKERFGWYTSKIDSMKTPPLQILSELGLMDASAYQFLIDPAPEHPVD